MASSNGTTYVTSDRFAVGMGKVMAAFGRDVRFLMKPSMNAAVREGRKAAKASAPVMTGTYAKSFSGEVKVSPNGDVVTGVVRNRVYQLTHLLEKGHAAIGGGFVEPRVHMAPAKRKAEDKLMRQLSKRIGEIR